MQKAIAIDFDGCLCTNEYPKIGKPILHVIDEAKKQQAKGAGLILWTCRETCENTGCSDGFGSCGTVGGTDFLCACRTD